jgi:hypothetical protein
MKTYWMRALLGNLVQLGLMAVGPCLAARSWYIEAKKRFSLEVPRWRSALVLVALGLASLSAVLSLLYYLRSWMHGELPYFDSVLLWFTRKGLLSALCALPCALIGKGRARWPSLGIALLMSVLWFGAAMAE